MAKLNSYRELLVWQKSMNLADRCYRMTRRFKRDDQLFLGHENSEIVRFNPLKHRGRVRATLHA